MSTHNRISGQVYANLVVQGRDITIQQPVVPSKALSSLPPQPVFVGRDEELASLLESLRAGSVVVTGLPGVGKTALAVRAAHELRAEFPGGVLFLDLRGYDDTPLTPEQALTDLLTALGQPAPAGEGHYRSVLADHPPLLLVADNAGTAAQVQPLLPGGHHRVLITSRHTLAELDARLLSLDVLPPDQAQTLLTDLLRQSGDDSREGPELAELVRLCGYLPLAIRITAADLAAHPSQPLSARVRALADEQNRLSALKFGPSLAVRASFDLSYRQLPPEQARMFRLLSVNPGEQTSTETAAALAELPEFQAERLLSELARAHLIEPGTPWGYWRMHDLLAVYAAELPEDRPQALFRLIMYFGPAAEQTSLHLMRSDRSADLQQAVDWLDLEHRTLLELVRIAEEYDQPVLILKLSNTLTTYLTLRHRFTELVWVSERAATAATALGDSRAAYLATQVLANAYTTAGRPADALACARQALSLAGGLGPETEADALGELGRRLLRGKDFAAAAEAYQRQFDSCQRLGDQAGQAVALSGLGRARLAGGEPGGLDQCARAVAISRAIGDQVAELAGLRQLAEAQGQLGWHAEAAASWRQHLALGQTRGDRHSQSLSVLGLSASLSRLGETAEAISWAREAVRLAEEVANDYAAGTALGLLASLLRTAGEHEEAQDCLLRALAIAERHDHQELAEQLRLDLD
ncbi:tetratricopeptide repeat protein [Crossiella sp. SN42]|uniref:ATP-binding protein n=1 Tax=Crossiella sp. SN42 TaxID=2944808 RepID=UPI00207C5025|nr:tetratricopeptide repeat protein [Crossiella sp. SN42]MCO1581141.1 tetratricopeptide repeat protein [Crossiella sp. SN42]